MQQTTDQLPQISPPESATPPIATAPPSESPAPSSAVPRANGGAAGAATGDDSSVVTDAQIAGVLDTANHAEIDQARVALHKTNNPRVKLFAERLITDHGRVESKLQSADTRDAVTPRGGPVSDRFKERSDRLLAGWRSEPAGADFDRAYIEAQIEEQQRVLALIDEVAPRTENSDLKGVLQEARARVTDHLREAKSIRGSLTSK
jgi:putative membrane protein